MPAACTSCGSNTLNPSESNRLRIRNPFRKREGVKPCLFNIITSLPSFPYVTAIAMFLRDILTNSSPPKK
jgi:hypothetical protein